MYSTLQWVQLNTNNAKLNKIMPDIYFVNIFGQVAQYDNISNSYKILKQTNTPTKAFVYLALKNWGYDQFTVKFLIMLTFSFREDYENHSIININKNLYDNRLDNLMWDDYTRFGNKIMTLPVPNIDTLPGEIWAPVARLGYTKDIEDGYLLFCSTYGRLYGYNKKIGFLNPSIDNGYYRVTISANKINGKRHNVHKLVHRIIMNTFKYNPNWQELQINHIDGNKLNNNINNLEWVTPLENTRHSRITRLNTSYSENHPLHVYTKEDVYIILNEYIFLHNNTSIINKLYPKYSCDFIGSVACASDRISDVTEYMIEHNFIPSKLFSTDMLLLIIKKCELAQNFREVYSYFNIKRCTPEYVSIGIIYHIIKNCISWIRYVDL